MFVKKKKYEIKMCITSERTESIEPLFRFVLHYSQRAKVISVVKGKMRAEKIIGHSRMIGAGVFGEMGIDTTRWFRTIFRNSSAVLPRIHLPL